MNVCRKNRMHPNRKKASGYTLIEVLIAVLILSIGLLSLAFTQANSMRYTHSAYLRSQATLLSGDILDSIRTNRMNAESGAYDITIGTPASGTGTIALNDLNTWKSNLAARLPQGDGQSRMMPPTVNLPSRCSGRTAMTQPPIPQRSFR